MPAIWSNFGARLSPSLVTTSSALKFRLAATRSAPVPPADKRNDPEPAARLANNSGSNRCQPANSTSRAFKSPRQASCARPPRPCAVASTSIRPPKVAGRRALKVIASRSDSRNKSTSTRSRTNSGNAAFQRCTVSRPSRISTWPAGRSSSVRRVTSLPCPSSSISEASANSLGPRRAITMSGESRRTRPARNLPLRASCQTSRPIRPPAARARTRWSSLDRSSRRSK